MKKGDIYSVVGVEQDASGVIVETDAGHVLGVIAAHDVEVGAKLQVGPVCGDWCKVFLKGETYRAQILQRSVKSS